VSEPLTSPRLRYQPLAFEHLDRFHALVQDAHIRRYLMDGEVFPREWSEDRVRDSEALMARRGVGLSLAFEKASGDLAGFCGFLELPSLHAEPQLVYALLERFTGQGYATEMARAAIEDARATAGFTDICAAVDEVNTASVRVLEKLGFERVTTGQGAFGNMFTYTLRR
jgi:[ribosomal protein S5]-alanine N-acetyltransferase